MDEGINTQIHQNLKQLQSEIDDDADTAKQSRFNRLIARYYLVSGEELRGVALLESTINANDAVTNTQSLIVSTHLLAAHYLTVDQPKKALMILNKITQYQYRQKDQLFLTATAYHALNEPIKALELISQSKILSNDAWTIREEEFLQEIVVANTRY